MKTYKELLNEMFGFNKPSKEYLDALADPNSWAVSLNHSKPEHIRRKKAVDDELETSNRDQIYSALTHRSIGMHPHEATDLISSHEDDPEAFQKLLRIIGKSKHPNAATARAWANKLDRQKAKGIKVFGESTNIKNRWDYANEKKVKGPYDLNTLKKMHSDAINRITQQFPEYKWEHDKIHSYHPSEEGYGTHYITSQTEDDETGHNFLVSSSYENGHHITSIDYGS